MIVVRGELRVDMAYCTRSVKVEVWAGGLRVTVCDARNLRCCELFGGRLALKFDRLIHIICGSTYEGAFVSLYIRRHTNEDIINLMGK